MMELIENKIEIYLKGFSSYLVKPNTSIAFSLSLIFINNNISLVNDFANIFSVKKY